MRCPPAVLRPGANVGEDGAPFYALARSELLNARVVEMANEQPEPRVVVSAVFQDDDAAIVAGEIANVACMNDTCEW